MFSIGISHIPFSWFLKYVDETSCIEWNSSVVMDLQRLSSPKLFYGKDLLCSQLTENILFCEGVRRNIKNYRGNNQELLCLRWLGRIKTCLADRELSACTMKGNPKRKITCEILKAQCSIILTGCI